jgi:hypothetical protein
LVPNGARSDFSLLPVVRRGAAIVRGDGEQATQGVEVEARISAESGKAAAREVPGEIHGVEGTVSQIEPFNPSFSHGRPEDAGKPASPVSQQAGVRCPILSAGVACGAAGVDVGKLLSLQNALLRHSHLACVARWGRRMAGNSSVGARTLARGSAVHARGLRNQHVIYFGERMTLG